ncbi:MAG: XdhC family protein [Crocinitomicaceae bacterium]|nr:XdhC family protein [Crocinitomicaceae bacterium]
MNIWHDIQNSLESGEKIAVCTVVNTSGSVPRHAGTKMLVFENGKISGTIGGGNLEKKVIENAIRQIAEGKSKLFKHDLVHHHNMCCGGQVEIFIEPVMPLDRLYIFGAGHTGQALAKLAADTEFETFLFDDRIEYLNNCTLAGVNKLLLANGSAISELPFNKKTYVVIATYDHQTDRNILSHCIKQSCAYIGMIGSQRKILMTKKMFLESGLSDEKKFGEIDTPIGLDIHAESPFEIAISIMAALIKKKNENN